jgi:hypothetical protein
MNSLNDIISILSCINLLFSIILGIGVYRIRKKMLQIEINPNLNIYLARDPINKKLCIYFNNLGPLPIRSVFLSNNNFFTQEIKVSDGFLEINKPIKVVILDEKLKYLPIIRAGDKYYFDCNIRFSNSFKKNLKIKYNHG